MCIILTKSKQFAPKNLEDDCVVGLFYEQKNPSMLCGRTKSCIQRQCLLTKMRPTFSIVSTIQRKICKISCQLLEAIRAALLSSKKAGSEVIKSEALSFEWVGIPDAPCMDYLPTLGSLGVKKLPHSKGHVGKYIISPTWSIWV